MFTASEQLELMFDPDSVAPSSMPLDASKNAGENTKPSSEWLAGLVSESVVCKLNEEPIKGIDRLTDTVFDLISKHTLISGHPPFFFFF